MKKQKIGEQKSKTTMKTPKTENKPKNQQPTGPKKTEKCGQTKKRL